MPNSTEEDRIEAPASTLAFETMAPQPQSGRGASRCILRDRRSVVAAAQHGCKRSGGGSGSCARYAQFCPRPTRRQRRQPPPNRLDTQKIVHAAHLARAIKTRDDCDKPIIECATGDIQEDKDLVSGNMDDQNEDISGVSAASQEANVEVVSIDTENTDNIIEEDQEELDEATNSRLARLQNYACPRMRRKALLDWVNQRVHEISREDAEEPDTEDQDIRSALMDAVGQASMNVEADLADVSLDFSKPLNPECDKSGDISPSRIRFADSAVTYVLSETEKTAAGPCWALDEVLETNVHDSPSAPLGKWCRIS